VFHGKPIIAYSILAAKDSGLFNEIYVSTDDWEIAKVAEAFGAHALAREESLSVDQVGTQDVMRRVLFALEDGKRDSMKFIEPYSYAACIYPCAPMLEPDTLARALNLLQMTDANYVVPLGTWLRDPGQFYMGKASAFLAGAPLLDSGTQLLPIDPRTDCDINTMEDFERAKRMYAELHIKRIEETA
jgi:pseudaminic acid cytidylyltransferase